MAWASSPKVYEDEPKAFMNEPNPINHMSFPNLGRDGQATYSTLHIRQGAFLPHWTKEGSTYAITFRLADSLPQHVIKQWQIEYDKFATLAKHNTSTDKFIDWQKYLSNKVEIYLDAEHGDCLLKDDRAAKVVADALKYFDEKRYTLTAWCIMPNHVHVVVRPWPGFSLVNILHSWKSFTAHAINKLLGRNGEVWQQEYYDHLIRDEDDFRRSVGYVLNNPEKAGLKKWKWVGYS